MKKYNFLNQTHWLLNLILIIWSIFCVGLGLKLFKYSNVQVKYQIPQQQTLALIIAGIFFVTWFVFQKKLRSTFIASLISSAVLLGLLIAFNPLGTLSVLLVLVSSCCLGRIFLDDNSFIKSTVLGLSFFMAFMNFFAHSPWNFKLVYLGLLLVPIFYEIKNFKWRLSESGDVSYKFHFSLSLLFIFITPTLLNSLRPEIGFDALSYQILAPYRLKQYGFYDFDPAINTMAVMPQGINWLYAIALVLSNELGMKLMVVVLGVLTAALCIEVGKDLNKPWEGLLAALCAISFPVFEMSSGFTFVENGAMLFTVASGLFGLLAERKKNTKYFLAATFLLIANLSTKQNSLIWVAIFGLGLVYLSSILKQINKFISRKFILTIVLGLICFVIPTYGYAFWRTGNPFFPFFNGIFKSSFYEPVSFNNTLFVHPYRWDLFYDLTKYSNKYLESDNGSAGILLLLCFPLFIYWLYQKRLTWISFCLAWAPWSYFFIVFHFQAYLRYFYPVLPLIFFGFAYAISEIENKFTKKIWTTALVVGCLIGFLLRGTTTFARDYELDKKWLWGNFEPLIIELGGERNINRYMNEKYDNKCRLVHINRPYNAFLNCDYYANTWHGWPFASKLALTQTADQAFQVLKTFKVSHITIYKSSPQNPAWSNDIIQKYLLPEYESHDLVLYKLKDAINE